MLYYLAAATIAASTLAATPGKVQWQADYGKALAATRSEQKPLVVVLDNPSEPQAAVDSALLSAKELTNYELCRVDASTAYGKQVVKAFGAQQLPHTAIIDRTGSVVLFKQPGKMAPSQWQTTLAKYQTGQRQTVAYRGPAEQAIFQSAYPVSNSGCPSCQRKAMGF